MIEWDLSIYLTFGISEFRPCNIKAKFQAFRYGQVHVADQ